MNNEQFTGGDFYVEPAGPACYETNIKRSRFTANVIPCADEDSAKERLKELCAIHRQADHNCWAYVLGTGPLALNLFKHSSDAGEPSGTAGRPILGEITRSGLINLLVVVARYFGGVKLGTRGLIEAYSTTAAKALALCPRAERARTRAVKVSFPYESMGGVAHLFSSAGNEGELQWDFSCRSGEGAHEASAKVKVRANVRISAFTGLVPKLDEMRDRKIISGYEIE